MALYFNNRKVKVNLNGKTRRVILPTTPIVKNKKLVSSDEYTLRDTNLEHIKSNEEA